MARRRQYAVLGLALGLRIAYRLVLDEPLLYQHQHMYFWSGLSIAESDDWLSHVLRQDDWRVWGSGFTLAPLYQLFLGCLFLLDGSRLLPVQLLQCLLGALTAVLVADLGLRVAPRLGHFAGLAYAVYWPAVSFPSRTMTENLHTPLLVFALWALVLGADSPNRGRLVWAGLLLGLSALARALSLAFAPIAAGWLLFLHGWRPALLFVAAVAAAILPWSARNALYRGDPVLIETVGSYNLWKDNAFVGEGRLHRQERQLRKASGAERRALATQFALRGVAREPGLFADKIVSNLRYLVRPDTLHGALIALYPNAGPWDILGVPFGDGLMLLAIPPFLVFAFAGPRSPARALTLLWCAYYLGLLVVVFHVETRYRSALMPFLFVGAAGGAEMLLEPASRRRWPSRTALAAGLAVVAYAMAPYAKPALAGRRSARIVAGLDLRPDRLQLAEAATAAASASDPNPARPWLLFGERLAGAGRSAEAVLAFERVEDLAPGHLLPRMLLPRLLLDLGRGQEAEAASEEARRVSWDLDPWVVLENAWRVLPPPRTDEIRLGRDDYGAVRGFHHPYRDYRWTRGKAWLRLVPREAGEDWELTLEMGSPEPSPNPRPHVEVRACDGPSVAFELTREVKPYSWRVHCEQAIVTVEITAPTFNRSGRRDDEGVRVDRLRVRPAFSRS